MENLKEFGRCPNRLLRSALVLTVALIFPGYAGAYSCYEYPFVKRAAETPTIFVATITGGSIVERENRDHVYATIDVVEILKGAVSFEHLVTSATYGMGSGIPFTIGGKYLVYASEDGQTSMCNNPRALSPLEITTNDIAQRELIALRIAASTNFREIVPPWHFNQFDFDEGYVSCEIKHDLQFSASTGADELPTGVLAIRWTGGVLPPERPPVWPQMTLTIGVPRGGGVAGYYADLSVGDIELKVVGAEPFLDFVPELFHAGDGDARNVLNALTADPEISIKSEHPKYGYIQARTDTSTMDDALNEMKLCMDRNQ